MCKEAVVASSNCHSIRLNQSSRPSAGMLITLTSDYESDVLPQYNNNNYYHHGGGCGVVYSTDVTSPCRKYRNPHNTLLGLFE